MATNNRQPITAAAIATACYSARVLNPATTQPQITTRPQIVAGALLLGALWFVLCRQLSGEWSGNEQYSYGWFVPFFAAFLFWLRWEERPGESLKAKGHRRRWPIASGIARAMRLSRVA